VHQPGARVALFYAGYSSPHCRARLQFKKAPLACASGLSPLPSILLTASERLESETHYLVFVMAKWWPLSPFVFGQRRG